MMQRSFLTNAARGLLAAGTALSLGFGAYAKDEPPALPVADPQPQVRDNADPDNFFDETGDRGRKYQPFNPFLDACEADRCLAVTMSEEAAGSDYLGWMTDRAVEHLMAGATADYVDWLESETGNSPVLITAIYENGELVSSNARQMDYPWLDETPDAQAPSDKPDWAFAPISGPFLSDLLASARASENSDAATRDNPDATASDYPYGYTPDRRSADMASASAHGARYPDGTAAVEIDPSAFDGTTPPEVFGDVFVDVPFGDRRVSETAGSGRVGLIALMNPSPVQAAAPVRSFALVLQLQD